MNATTLPMPAHSSLRSYLLEAKYEFIAPVAHAVFALPSLLFPALFYLLFWHRPQSRRQWRRRARNLLGPMAYSG